MCENKSEAKKLSVKTCLMPYQYWAEKVVRWCDKSLAAVLCLSFFFFFCWASRAIRKIAGVKGGCKLLIQCWTRTFGWQHIRTTTVYQSKVLWGKKRPPCRTVCSLAAAVLLLWFVHWETGARVMCLGKYVLAFLPPNSNTMIIYFTLPITPRLSSLFVTVNDCLANWNIVSLLCCYYQEEG